MKEAAAERRSAEEQALFEQRLIHMFEHSISFNELLGMKVESVAAGGVRVRIPMRDGLRSINVALAATLILGEAKRQTDGFTGLQ